MNECGRHSEAGIAAENDESKRTPAGKLSGWVLIMEDSPSTRSGPPKASLGCRLILRVIAALAPLPLLVRYQLPPRARPHPHPFCLRVLGYMRTLPRRT